ncbi:MAG: DUF2950 domain-containing protein [Burkholderiaceae bacterium]
MAESLLTGRALRAVVWVCVLAGVAPVVRAQAGYPSPEAAAQALVDAIATSDEPAVRKVLGPDAKRLVPIGVDDASLRADTLRFLSAWSEAHRIVESGDGWAHLDVGRDHWRFPVPLARRAGAAADAAWAFDTKAGENVLRLRRIGRNELATMHNLLDYVDAQQYYREVRVKAGQTPEYAGKLYSTPGQRDGLYWDKRPGWPDSPLGPLTASMGEKVAEGEAFFGYRYKPLEAQGPHAKDGPKGYRVKGRLTEGFAMIAWPARYGETGVMTFIVNQDGRIYQRNLGPRTAAIAAAIRTFNPEGGWEPTRP